MLISQRIALLVALSIASVAAAQSAGEWRYSISTDLTNIPADMRVNFPTITFSACRSADDFASGRAFALQTLASSTARCPSRDFVRTPMPDGKGDTLQFVYACDEGKTLSGVAEGRVQDARFTVALASRYLPAVNGVAVVKQNMRGERVGPCKVKPDADALKVQ
jgi:hypothetical protein